MELPDEWVRFSSFLVLPNIPCQVIIPNQTDCSITNVALDQHPSYPKEGRVVLYLTVSGSPPVAVVPFTLSSFESATIDLHFAGNERLIFTSTGVPIPLHISGYISEEGELQIDNGITQEVPVVDVKVSDE